MSGWQGFSGINRGYVLELYERFSQDPSSVDPDTRALFERWTPPADDGRGRSRRTHAGARGRRRGQPRPVDPALRASRRPARSARLEADRRSDAAAGAARPDAKTICSGSPPRWCRRRSRRSRRTCTNSSRRFRRVYCSTTGYDYSHVFVPEERQWLRKAAEDGRFREPADPIDPVALLERLTAGRGVRALPAPHVSRQDALLDRRARHAGADPRRGDRRRRRGGHADRS